MADSLLEQRRIEAEFAKALLESLAEETGRERALEILAKTVIKLATKAGQAFAEQNCQQAGIMAQSKPAGLLAYAEILDVWQQDGALTIGLKVKTGDRLEFDVTRCRYAEMYRELGMADLGRLLSCNRDGAFCKGFDPAIRLTRTQTIMDGAACCDFRYEMGNGT